jgi:hypothetical protein
LVEESGSGAGSGGSGFTVSGLIVGPGWGCSGALFSPLTAGRDAGRTDFGAASFASGSARIVAGVRGIGVAISDG